MIVAMDLNASPIPEEDEETFEGHEEYSAPEERIESGADIARREREERRMRLKRDRSDEKPIYASQPHVYDQSFQTKTLKTYDKSRLPLLGLVIDLTNTTRYYSTVDLKKDAIKHVKIQCKGRGSVPDNSSVNQFVYEVSQFLSRQKHSKKYILVHCTHGHNRTGYMIVHYLMRSQSFSVQQAIQIFAEARPPGIYKPDYIEALYAFYHEKKPEVFVCPPTPEWKRSSDLDLNGEAVPDDDDDGVSAAPLHETQDISVVMTNDDVLGDEIPWDQQDAFRQFCYQSLKLGVGPRGNTQFPGSHPVSLNRDNLQLLRQRYYYATWKADGTRYMMLITMDGCYLIDRNFNCRRVQMRFPCRSTNEVLGERMHHYTLLDGEMIIDKLPDSHKQERRYLIYDMIAINQVSVIEVHPCAYLVHLLLVLPPSGLPDKFINYRLHFLSLALSKA
ncbi:hypothetical protein FNV43_RR09708 [Rhamnella rubrinervis]|uniref:mRNA-capping enzyme-like n=1 Tax=Rhamnella rubrinervis TaxID=2594499 RepID=A0A8K0MK11_9ROSA|nr:hypothetical protein FNV43_RR09708 [Rhamnella rubrinervis]